MIHTIQVFFLFCFVDVSNVVGWLTYVLPECTLCQCLAWRRWSHRSIFFNARPSQTPNDEHMKFPRQLRSAVTACQTREPLSWRWFSVPWTRFWVRVSLKSFQENSENDVEQGTTESVIRSDECSTTPMPPMPLRHGKQLETSNLRSLSNGLVVRRIGPFGAKPFLESKLKDIICGPTAKRNRLVEPCRKTSQGCQTPRNLPC